MRDTDHGVRGGRRREEMFDFRHERFLRVGDVAGDGRVGRGGRRFDQRRRFGLMGEPDEYVAELFHVAHFGRLGHGRLPMSEIGFQFLDVRRWSTALRSILDRAIAMMILLRAADDRRVRELLMAGVVNHRLRIGVDQRLIGQTIVDVFGAGTLPNGAIIVFVDDGR